jgi:NAD(P)-dependent dehydrogenase (short-subunit alcohol dehydrogenase family)
MDLQLAGKRAIVTGASRGIGYAVAAALAAEGADLVLVARDQAALDAAAERLARPGRRVLAVAADTTDDHAVRAMADRTVTELGGVDILVNAAAQPGGASPARGLADVVTFLASPRSVAITGDAIAVGGGTRHVIHY